MAKQKKQYKGKKQYSLYQVGNRALKNKIANIERHIRKFPNDEKAKQYLKRIMKSGYRFRKAPKPSSTGEKNKRIKINELKSFEKAIANELVYDREFKKERQKTIARQEALEKEVVKNTVDKPVRKKGQKKKKKNHEDFGGFEKNMKKGKSIREI